MGTQATGECFHSFLIAVLKINGLLFEEINPYSSNCDLEKLRTK